MKPLDYSFHTEALSPKLHKECQIATNKYPPEYFAELIIKRLQKPPGKLPEKTKTTYNYDSGILGKIKLKTLTREAFAYLYNTTTVNRIVEPYNIITYWEQPKHMMASGKIVIKDNK